MNRRAVVVSLAFGLLAAVAAALAPQSPGYTLNGDVTGYLGSARSLVEEGRLRHPLGTIADETTDAPLAHWPPGYPIALAVPIALGASPDLAAQIVRVVSAFVSVFVALLLVGSVAGPVAAVLAGALIFATPSIVGIHLTPLSEAFFTALVVLLTYAMVTRPDRPLIHGLLAAAVVLTRYIGVAFAAAACLWALLQPGRPSRRLGRAVVAGLPTLVTQLLWLARTHHVSGNVRNVGEQAPLGETVRKLAGAVSRWLAPALPDWPLVSLLKLVVLVVFCGLVGWATLHLWRTWRSSRSLDAARTLSLVALAATFTVLYYLVYVLARIFADYALDFHPRYWAPLELLYAAILAISLTVWWREGRAWLGAPAAAVVGLWWAAALAASTALVADTRREQVANDAAMANSRFLAWARAEAADRELVSNWGAVLWRYLGRSTRELPIVDDPALESLLVRRLRASDALVVNFIARDPLGMLPPGRRYMDPDTIAARLGLREVARFPEAVVYALPEGAASITRADDGAATGPVTAPNR